MDTLIHADIFFFIASIGFVLLIVLISIALNYLIRLIRRTTLMAERLEGNIETIGEEAKDMIMEFRDSPVMGFLFGRKRRKTLRSKEK